MPVSKVIYTIVIIIVILFLLAYIGKMFCNTGAGSLICNMLSFTNNILGKVGKIFTIKI